MSIIQPFICLSLVVCCCLFSCKKAKSNNLVAKKDTGNQSSQIKPGSNLPRIHNNGGRCQLKSATQTISLKIPFPCSFHKDLQGNIRRLNKSDTTIFLIESSKPHPELEDACETHIQALQKVKGIYTASAHSDKVASCPPFQWDEPMFVGLF